MVRMSKTNSGIYQKPLSHIIADEIRSRIWNREIQFGERLYETALAEEMQVSRSSLREAMKTLEFEGLIINKARKGTFVADFTIEDMKEINEARLILETQASMNATRHLNDTHLDHLNIIVEQMGEEVEKENLHELFDLDIRFHTYVVGLCGNTRIIQLYELLSIQIRTFLAHLTGYYKTQTSLFWFHHKDLMQTLKTKDPEFIKDAFSNHIRGAGQEVLKFYENRDYKVSKECN